MTTVIISAPNFYCYSYYHDYYPPAFEYSSSLFKSTFRPFQTLIPITNSIFTTNSFPPFRHYLIIHHCHPSVFQLSTLPSFPSYHTSHSLFFPVFSPLTPFHARLTPSFFPLRLLYFAPHLCWRDPSPAAFVSSSRS